MNQCEIGHLAKHVKFVCNLANGMAIYKCDDCGTELLVPPELRPTTGAVDLGESAASLAESNPNSDLVFKVDTNYTPNH